MLFTNNSSRTRLEYVEKFKKMNIEIFEEEIVTAGYMLGEYLIEKRPALLYIWWELNL